MLSRSKLLALAVIVSLLLSLYTLNLLNLIVHEDLYDYGLRFSEAWAVPYWNMLHLTVGLVVGSMVLVLLPYLQKLPLPFTGKQKNRLAELETKKPHKVYGHVLYFGYVDDAEDFRQLLWDRIPDLKVRLQTLGKRASLSFVLPEPIEDLDSFKRVTSYKIKEVIV